MLHLTIPIILIVSALPPSSQGPGGDPAENLRPRWMPSKDFAESISAGRDYHKLVLKLQDDSGHKVIDGRLVTETGADFALGQALQARGIVAHRAISQSDNLLRGLRDEGQERSRQELVDLTQYYMLVLPTESIPEEVLETVLASPLVENAYFSKQVRQPSTPSTLTTPDLTGSQEYHDSAPLGIGLSEARSRGLMGGEVAVCDIEQSWRLEHEEFVHLQGQQPAVPLIPMEDWASATEIEHGTAVLGVLAADASNGLGIDGIAPESDYFVVPTSRTSEPNWGPAQAIALATIRLRAGDVLLIEVETSLGEPIEISDLEYGLIRQATALGIHVVEPAGNGGADLDQVGIDPILGIKKFNITDRDSGAVFVGSSKSGVSFGGHQKRCTSNFGSRCDAYSWGENVTTTGSAGTVGTDPCTGTPGSSCNANPGAFGLLDSYTSCFTGTSSAGAIVAGAAALLEEYHEDSYGQVFDVTELRNLLRLGTESTLDASNKGNVGHQPNLDYQLDLIDQGVIPRLLRPNPDTVPSSANVSHEAGFSVACGDTNGDGVIDVVGGAPGTEDVICWDGATGAVRWTSPAINNRDWGFSVVCVGDVDGDSNDDFLVGAPGLHGNDDSGYASIVSGFSGGEFLTTYDIDIAGGYDIGAGEGLAALWDLNSDGFNDFAVGNPLAEYSQGIRMGQVQFFSGDPNAGVAPGIAAGLGGALFGSVNNGRFGAAVTAIGDQNGDGYAEIAIGEPRNGSGKVHVYDRANLVFLCEFEADQTDSEFGHAIAACGDLDGDGFGEILVGAPGGNGGAVYVYKGGPQGAWTSTQTPKPYLARFQADILGQDLGTAVAFAGDFDGDGVPDIAAGAPTRRIEPTVGLPYGQGTGRVYVYSNPLSTTGMVRYEFPASSSGTLFGASLCFAGDMLGDGRDMILVGESSGEVNGRVYAFTHLPSADPGFVPRLVATSPFIEICDKSTPPNGMGGGGFSPALANLIVQGGATWANSTFTLDIDLVVPGGGAPSPYSIFPFVSGTTGPRGGAVVQFGPFSTSTLEALEDGVFTFRAIGPGSSITNPVTVSFSSEYDDNCQ